MLKNITNMLRDEEGATLVEYGLLVALVAVVAIGVITVIGKQVSNSFSTVSSSL